MVRIASGAKITFVTLSTKHMVYKQCEIGVFVRRGNKRGKDESDEGMICVKGVKDEQLRRRKKSRTEQIKSVFPYFFLSFRKRRERNR